jgi:hypothetical protein
MGNFCLSVAILLLFGGTHNTFVGISMTFFVLSKIVLMEVKRIKNCPSAEA